jgi:hypothetical protein
VDCSYGEGSSSLRSAHDELVDARLKAWHDGAGAGQSSQRILAQHGDIQVISVEAA